MIRPAVELAWTSQDLSPEQVRDAADRYAEARVDIIDTAVDHRVDQHAVDYSLTDQVVIDAMRWPWGGW